MVINLRHLIIADYFRVYPTVLSSLPVWLFSLLIIIVAFIPDVVIRVLRKHWSFIIVELHRVRRGINKKMKKETFLPQDTFYNPTFENVVGKTIRRNTSLTC